MHGQAQHLATNISEFLALRIDRAEKVQQFLSALDGLWIRFVEPIKGGGFPNTERVQKQNNFGQIAALNFRSIAFGAIEVIAFGPQPIAGAGRGPARATFALVSRGAADFFDEQRGNAALCIVARNTRQTAGRAKRCSRS